jgi:hypothetical protein
VRFLSRLVEVLVGRRSEHRRRQVKYRPSGDALETRTLLSPLSLGPTARGFSHHEIGQSLLGAADVHHVKIVRAADHVDASTLAPRVIYDPVVPGISGPAITADQNVSTPGKVDPKDPGGVELVQTADSGKIDPKDPGGVELVQTVDSGKVDPKDPEGVELVRTADSGKIDPKDPGGVELDWVDRGVVDRLGRS